MKIRRSEKNPDEVIIEITYADGVGNQTIRINDDETMDLMFELCKWNGAADPQPRDANPADDAGPHAKEVK